MIKLDYFTNSVIFEAFELLCSTQRNSLDNIFDSVVPKEVMLNRHCLRYLFGHNQGTSSLCSAKHGFLMVTSPETVRGVET